MRKTIYIDYGVSTPIEVDLSDFDFSGIQKVILTGKNMKYDEVIFEREFTSAAVHNIVISPEESRLVKEYAEYDLNIVLTDGKRYKEGENGKIFIRKGAGECSQLQ